MFCAVLVGATCFYFESNQFSQRLLQRKFFARLCYIMKCFSRQRFVELASQWRNTISRRIERKMPDSYLGVSSDLMQSIHAHFLCAAGRNIKKVSKCKGTWKG